MCASSTGPYPLEGTTNDTSAMAANLPPPKPVRPMTLTPIRFATSAAARMFGELPEAEMATSRSPIRARFFSGSLKMWLKSVSLAQAVISETLSVSAMTRNRFHVASPLWPSVPLQRSFIMCDAVAALPPLPMTKICRSSACASAMASATRSTASRGSRSSTPFSSSK